jgi:hypothetical protein
MSENQERQKAQRTYRNLERLAYRYLEEPTEREKDRIDAVAQRLIMKYHPELFDRFYTYFRIRRRM